MVYVLFEVWTTCLDGIFEMRSHQNTVCLLSSYQAFIHVISTRFLCDNQPRRLFQHFLKNASLIPSNIGMLACEYRCFNLLGISLARPTNLVSYDTTQITQNQVRRPSDSSIQKMGFYFALSSSADENEQNFFPIIIRWGCLLFFPCSLNWISC